MTKYSSASVVVEFDNAGGSLVDMSQYVDNNFDLAPTAETVETTAFGDSWRERMATLKDGGQITLSGWFDDTATTGPDVIFNALGNTTSRTLKVTWGGTKTSSIETIIVGYKRSAQIGQLVRYEVTLQATGAITET